MKFLKQKKIVALLAIAVVAIAAVGAYAYFTTTGSGVGAASVGNDTPLAITQSGSITGLTPGGGARNVSYAIANTPGSNGVQNLGAVSVSNIVVDGPHATAGCLAAWFSSTTAGTPVGTIAAGATYNSVSATEPSVQLDNINSSQDACQGATISFDLNAAQGS